MLTPLVWAIVLIALGISVFWLGWDSASRQERRAKQAAERRLRDLGEWVRQNWPNEHAAYKEGYQVGYQQGILHSDEAEAEALS